MKYLLIQNKVPLCVCNTREAAESIINAFDSVDYSHEIKELEEPDPNNEPSARLIHLQEVLYAQDQLLKDREGRGDNW